MSHFQQTRISLYILIVACAILFAQPVFAEESVYDSYQQSTVSEEQVPSDTLEVETNLEEDLFLDSGETSKTAFFLVLKIIFYLIIILFLIYGLIKFLASRQRKLSPHQLFQTLGGTSLGHNKSLQIVKVGNTYYLLGVAEQISLIKEITSPEEIALIEREIAEEESIITKGFGQLFHSKRSTAQDKNPNSFQNLFEESLKEQKSKRKALEKNLSTIKDDNEEGTSR